MGDWEQKNHLINELVEGRELAKQLQSHLNLPNETREVLVQKIIASYEKALSMLDCSTFCTSSPLSLNGSPRSDQDSDPKHRNTGLRKRKSMPRWTTQVRVSPEMGIEGLPEDGFSWRKYGKKDILGAKHPRGYYRCTHRHVLGCFATKQVQRSDQDPTIFEVAYKGRHTCNNNSTSSAAPPPPDDQTQQESTHHSPQNQSAEQLLMAYFSTGLKVLTDDLDTTHQDHAISTSFHVPSTSNVVIKNPENQFLPVQNNLAENFTPPFLSPETSGTSYFGGYQNFQSCEADQFTEIISSLAATSRTNSSTVGLDFQFGNAEFDTHFKFDSPGFNSNW